MALDFNQRSFTKTADQANIDEGKFNCVVVKKPFYDPKKKIASS